MFKLDICLLSADRGGKGAVLLQKIVQDSAVIRAVQGNGLADKKLGHEALKQRGNENPLRVSDGLLKVMIGRKGGDRKSVV